MLTHPKQPRWGSMDTTVPGLWPQVAFPDMAESRVREQNPNSSRFSA